MADNAIPVVEIRIVGLDELRQRCTETISLIDEIETRLQNQFEALNEAMEKIHFEKSSLKL